MRVIYMGKNKPSVLAGLASLLAKSVEVVAVVADVNPGLDGEDLGVFAQLRNIPILTDDELYTILDDPEHDMHNTLHSVDLIISFLFWKRIRKPLLELGPLGCINFHPAPLPDYRGWGAYNFGVLNESTEWGVSAHYVDEDFDTGALIEVRSFPVDPATSTAFSLEQESQLRLIELLNHVIDQLLRGEGLQRTPQDGGCYYSREMSEAERIIQPSDSPAQVARRIRAFWYPPYSTAVVERDGQWLNVVNAELLEDIGKLLRSQGTFTSDRSDMEPT